MNLGGEVDDICTRHQQIGRLCEKLGDDSGVMTTALRRSLSTLINARRIRSGEGQLAGLGIETGNTEYSPLAVSIKERFVSAFYGARGENPRWSYFRQVFHGGVSLLNEIESTGNFHARLDLQDREYLEMILQRIQYYREIENRGEEDNRIYGTLVNYFVELMTYMQFRSEHMTNAIQRSEYQDAIDPRISQEKARDIVKGWIRCEIDMAHRHILDGYGDSFERRMLAVLERRGAVVREPVMDRELYYEEAVAYALVEQEDYAEITRQIYLAEVYQLLGALADYTEEGVFDPQSWIDEYSQIRMLERAGTWILTDVLINLIEDRVVRDNLQQVDTPRELRSIIRSLKVLTTYTIALSGHRGREMRFHQMNE